jgi:histidinol-phosphatase (PHP family)
MLTDYHMHTDHSGDGVTPLCAMIEGAIAKGCGEICITSHYDANYPLWLGENYEPDLPAYCRDIKAAAALYAGRITVRAGAELGLMADREDVLQKTNEETEGVAFDFLIGSLHCLGPQYVSDESEYFVGHTHLSFVEMVTQHLLTIARTYNCFDVMGHLTYFSRYSPLETKQQRYEDTPQRWDAVFEALISRGKGIEINTSTKGRLGFFMPDIDLVRRYRELGGEIVTIGSDAHVPGDIARYNAQAREMLKAAGFSYHTVFAARKPEFIRL